MDPAIGCGEGDLVTDIKMGSGGGTGGANVNSDQPPCGHEYSTACSSLIAEMSLEGEPANALTKAAETNINNDEIKADPFIFQTIASNDQEEEKTDASTPEKIAEPHCNDELSRKIIGQVEYYFSDENLVKDSFLMQRISRDKRGYVDLRLIASFKKMKKLSQDITVVADALRNSKKLEVNKAGTMVRRTCPLPAMKEDAAAKMVVAINVTDTTDLAGRFGSCGTVLRVRTISRNENVPVDVRKHLKRSLVDGGRALTDIAVIEYEDEKSAQAACVSLTDSSDWRRGLHVSMLVGRVPEKKSPSSAASNQNVKSSPVKDANADEAKSAAGDETSPNEMRSSSSKKKTNKKNRSRIEAILQDESGGCSSSGSETDGPDDQDWRSSSPKSKQHSSSPRRSSGSTGRSNAAQSIVAHRKLSLAGEPPGEVRARSGSTGAIECGSRGVSPWVQRRLQAAQNDSKPATSSLNDLSSGDNSASTGKLTDLLNVLRQPKGPDGTRGFKLVR